jgi:hypothetical protein
MSINTNIQHDIKQYTMKPGSQIKRNPRNGDSTNVFLTTSIKLQYTGPPNKFGH